MTTTTKKADLPAIAVIGSGYWGRNLVRNFNLLGALLLICDKNSNTLDQLKKEYPEVDICMAFSDVLNRSDIDGVVIATPAETHYRLSKEALLAGKHVFVEKPLVMNESEGVELIELAKSKKRILMVGHLLQYHPIFMKLKEMSLSGELGRINYIFSNRLNLGKIRREENILWSFAPHDISMILSLAEDEPETVYATGGCYLHKKIADVTTTNLEFKSGLQAHIFVSWLHPFKEQKLVVIGDKKMAVFNDTKDWDNKLFIYEHEIKWEHNIPIPNKAEPEKVKVIQKEPLRKECEHFLHCIQTGEEPITNGMEGLRVLRVLNASQTSLDQRGKAFHLRQGMNEARYEPDISIHPSVVIDEDVLIGKETKIWHFSHVLKGSKIGENCNIGQNVVIGPDVTIGDRCKIQNNVSVYKGVTLEDGVFCGPSMVFTNIYNPRAEIRKMDQVRPTVVKKGATLGANSTIICGNTIGKYAFVGAGALVHKNILDHELVVGNPVRRIGWVCACGERLTEDLTCFSCQRQYTHVDSGLEELNPA